MFTENTGRHLLDSGGAYGRHWEKNQGVNFLDIPCASFELSTWHCRDEKELRWGTDYSRNSFHYCDNYLYFEKELDRSWLRFANKPENKNASWLKLMEQWVEKKFKGEAGGIYGDSDPLMRNTYNEENNLSQGLQFLYFEVEGDGYYLLQVHGGYDVRGGYSTPRVFSDNGCCELGLLSNLDDGTLYCSACESRWFHETYDGWTNDDDSTLSIDNKMPVIEVDTKKDWWNRPMINQNQIELIPGCAPDKIGTIYVFEKQASCPCCGSGILEA